jgi:hypothetical protein
MTPILSEYQNGTRNARVYKTHSGNYGVVYYDAQDDFNGFESFENIDKAEDFAEDWVLGYESV